jgi:hypothetical protein
MAALHCGPVGAPAHTRMYSPPWYSTDSAAASHCGQSAVPPVCRRLARKLSRSFATLLDALNRHRGKGQQKVTVEHVHVHSGGQAIVGAVGPGGGIASKDEEQRHAKQLAYAPEPPLRSADTAREPVPVASDGERSLQDARGPVTRPTEG